MSLKISRGKAWAVWGVLFVPYLYLAAVAMPGLMEDMKAVAVDAACAKPLDLFLFGFTEAQAMEVFGCLGEAGRAVYRAGELSQDTVYPVSYALFLSFTLWALSGLMVTGRKRFFLTLLPFVAMIFDFVENAYIVQLIDQYPELDASTLLKASVGNQMKWFFALVSIALIVVFALLSAVRVVRGR